MPTCDDCGFKAKTERGLGLHSAAKHPPQVDGDVHRETQLAIDAADHLTDQDRGVVEVLLELARTIDGIPERETDAPMDNVTIPTFLKYANALGLTPESRAKLDLGEDRGGSKLAQLRSIRGGKAS